MTQEPDPFLSYDNEQSQLPPPYTNGADVTKSSELSQSVVYITIDQDQNTPFKLGDFVTGKIYISPKVDVYCKEVLIDLQETVYLRAKRWSLTPNIIRSLILSRYTLSPDVYPNDRIFRQGLRYSFTYSMMIPWMHSHDQCECNLPFHYHLPPSLGSNYEQYEPDYDVPEKHVIASYNIRAQLVSGESDKVVSKFKQYFDLMPEYPPTLPERYSYPISAKNTLLSSPVIRRPRSNKSKHPTVELTIPHVPVININQTDVTLQTIKLEFKHYPNIPAIKNIRTQLLAYTTTTLTPITDRYPDPSDSGVISKVESFSSQGRKQQSETDRRLRVISQDRDDSFIALLNVPLDITQKKINTKKLVPTFFSCHCSRQYRMKITIQLKYTKATLEFPIVLVYSDDTHAPKYTHT